MTAADPRSKLDDLSSSLPLELPPPQVYARMRAAIDAEAASPRPRRAGRGVGTLLALPAVTLTLLAADVFVRHRDLFRSDLLFSVGLCLPSAMGAVAIALLTTLLALSPGPDGLGERVSVLRSCALSVVPLSLIPMAFLVRLRDGGNLPPEPFDPWGIPCFLIGSVIAMLSLGVLAWRLRRSVPVATGWRSAALGAAAGAWSGLGLLIHCPSVEPQHVFVGHLLPICLFPLIGLLFARRFVRL